jgi:hypothetical protein
MTLINYRDAGMITHTWFWVDHKGRMISPFFDSEQQAREWAESTLHK